MKRLISIKLIAACLLAACVTVNVYFPAAAAEQAADRIIDTVTGQPGGAKPSDPAQPANQAKGPPNSSLLQPNLRLPGSMPAAPARGQLMSVAWTVPESAAVQRQTPPDSTTSLAGAVLDLLIPAAQAQSSPNIDLSDPQIRAVTASMQQRFGEMKKYFDAGVIGLTADGQVAVRDQNSVALTERAVVTRLVSEDNRDRATLYAELARANKHPEWEPDIRRTFARRWVERGAQPGWYYQDAGSKWVQK